MKTKSLIVIAGLVLAVLLSAVSYGQPFTDRPPSYRPELGRTFIPPSLSGPPAGGPSRFESGVRAMEDYSCDGAPTINFRAIPDVTRLQWYLDNSFSSEYLVRGVYRLCFINGPRDFMSGVTFNREAGYGTTPVLISGLKTNIAPSAPADTVSLTINGDGVALDQAELHGEGNAAGLIVNGAFVRLYRVTIDGFNNGIEVNSNFVITEEAIVHGSGGVGSGIILRGRSDSIIASRIDNFNIGVEIWGEGDFLGPDTYVPDQIVELYDNNIGIDVHQKARLTFIKNYDNRIAKANFDPALGLAKPIVELQSDTSQQNKGKALHAGRNSDGSIYYWLQFGDAPEGVRVTIYKVADGSYFGECTILPEGKCILSISEDVRLSSEQYWSLVDDPSFTLPFADPFEFGDPIPISYVGVDVPVDIPSSGSSFVEGTGGGSTAVVSGGESSGGGGVIKTSGGCGGGGGGATIVPPNGYHLVSSWLTLWWLIFTAPLILVAVRIKKRR